MVTRACQIELDEVKMVDITDPRFPGKLEIAEKLLSLFPESWRDRSPSPCEPMKQTKNS